MPDKDNFGAVLMRQREGKDGGGKGPLISEEKSLTLATANDQVLAFAADDYKDGTYEACETARPLTTSADRSRSAPIAATAMQVRRLTPVECERLQGFPDNFTRIPWKKKPAEDCPDGPRYKALGNSMAVPCMKWIGERIDRQSC
jgi:DNA (cytosine-5)-methyltransferase 1